MLAALRQQFITNCLFVEHTRAKSIGLVGIVWYLSHAVATLCRCPTLLHLIENALKGKLIGLWRMRSSAERVIIVEAIISLRNDTFRVTSRLAHHFALFQGTPPPADLPICAFCNEYVEGPCITALAPNSYRAQKFHPHHFMCTYCQKVSFAPFSVIHYVMHNAFIKSNP